MRLVAVSMVRNEGDIIEAFVRHHAGLLDHLVVLDHNSSDNTPAVLKALQAEGLPLTVLHDESLSFQQGPRLTDLARRCFAQVGADFVFPLDGDEFLRVESRAALEQALLRVPAGACGKVPWQTYVASDVDDATEANPVRRMRHRVAEEPKADVKVVLTRLLLSDARWQLVPGSHMLFREMADGATQAADMVFVEGVRLAHFPLRSQQQYQQKILLGWLSTRLQNPTEMVAAESGQQMTAMFWHWRELFARLLTDPSLTPADLREHALRMYVDRVPLNHPFTAHALLEDPVAVDYALSLTTAHDSIALVSLALWADRLLTRVGEKL